MNAKSPTLDTIPKPLIKKIAGYLLGNVKLKNAYADESEKGLEALSRVHSKQIKKAIERTLKKAAKETTKEIYEFTYTYITHRDHIGAASHVNTVKAKFDMSLLDRKVIAPALETLKKINNDINQTLILEICSIRQDIYKNFKDLKINPQREESSNYDQLSPWTIAPNKKLYDLLLIYVHLLQEASWKHSTSPCYVKHYNTRAAIIKAAAESLKPNSSNNVKYTLHVLSPLFILILLVLFIRLLHSLPI